MARIGTRIASATAQMDRVRTSSGDFMKLPGRLKVRSMEGRAGNGRREKWQTAGNPAAQRGWRDALKIATYNVNGVNGRMPRLVEWLAETAPDVACLQEIKTTDEKYSNLKLQDNIHVLAQATEGGKPQPLLFTSEYGKGRMFQTALGHDLKAKQNPHFRDTLVRGTKWAAGEKVED